MKTKVMSVLFAVVLTLSMTGCHSTADAVRETLAKNATEVIEESADVTPEELLAAMSKNEVPDEYVWELIWTENTTSTNPDKKTDSTIRDKLHIENAVNYRHVVRTLEGTGDSVPSGNWSTDTEIYADFVNDRTYQTVNEKWVCANKKIDPSDVEYYALCLPALYYEDIKNAEFTPTSTEYVISGNISASTVSAFTLCLGNTYVDFFDKYISVDCAINIELTFDRETKQIVTIRMFIERPEQDSLKMTDELIWNIDMNTKPNTNIPEDVINNAEDVQ